MLKFILVVALLLIPDTAFSEQLQIPNLKKPGALSTPRRPRRVCAHETQVLAEVSRYNEILITEFLSARGDGIVEIWANVKPSSDAKRTATIIVRYPHKILCIEWSGAFARLYNLAPSTGL